ncbi:hydrolase [Photobacterium jeanii]|uniref:Hydrolase n=1 Tax=Photobacterium jeanii TaxID=858640 RepID=A0A178KNC2_9GAMM|nr:alpha/beta hydrolase [Photobacterium jeanii]OAN18475.1 hydrolase [Photobacterium jeanii]PST91843.1 alpha/beta hydrolase [Photobacterium jeanii]
MKEMAFQLAERQLAGLSAGVSEDEKPLLLFLHGWQDNAASFSALFPQLGHHYRLMALDWPGHGHSERRDGDNYYHFADYLDDLHQVINQLECRSLVLVGHSLGALVASAYCGAFPEKVAGLVLIEGLGPLYEAPENAIQRLRDGILSRQRFRTKQQQKPRRAMRSLEQAIALRCNINHVTPEQIRPLVERGVVEIDGAWYWRHDERLRCDSLYRMTKAHSEAYLREISCPVLSIVGEQGFPRLQQRAPELEWIPDIQQVTVSGGHHCHLESPLTVCEQIMLYVSKIESLV